MPLTFWVFRNQKQCFDTEVCFNKAKHCKFIVRKHDCISTPISMLILPQNTNLMADVGGKK